MSMVDNAENRSTYRSIAVARTSGGGSLVMNSFGDVVSFAELMARSQHAIPAHLRGNTGACMAVTLLAMRIGVDPFALASKSYSTKEGATIAYEAQVFAAIVNTLAPIKRRPDYLFEGQGEKLRCTVTAEMNDGSIKIYTSPEIGKIPVKNSPLWKGDPEQQLGYYSIRAWARRYVPEVTLGIYSPEEIESAPRIGPDRARDVTPPKTTAAKLDALAKPEPRHELRQDASHMANHNPETGEIEDDAAADSAATPLTASADEEPFPGDPTPREALLGRLRGRVMEGAGVMGLLSTLAKDERALLTDDDVASLRRAEKALAGQGRGGK